MTITLINPLAFITLFKNETLKQLAAPFPPSDVEWRVGSTNKEKTRGLALAYITARAVMNRLDIVMGPENWYDKYVPGPDGGVMCELSVCINGKWVTKCGLAENSDIEAVKGGESDSLKRAAVKFGIGRYLYYLPDVWAELKNGKYIAEDPDLVRITPWAVPEEYRTKTKPEATTTRTSGSSRTNGGNGGNGGSGTRRRTTQKKADPKPKPEEVLEDVTAEVPPGDFVVTQAGQEGKENPKHWGTRIADLSENALGYYAGEKVGNLVFRPKAEAGKALQKAAKAFKKEAVAEPA